MITSWIGGQLGALIADHLLIAVALILFIEELGIPMPVPGDLIMLAAGVEVSRGNQTLWAVLLVEEAATVAGSTVLFFVSRHVGHPLVERFGRYIGFGPDRLDQVAERVNRHAGRAIIAGRLIPGLRIVSVIAAGVVEVPGRVFVPSLALGAGLYLAGYTLVGYFAGPPVLSFFAGVAIPVSGILSLIGLGVLFVLMRMFRRAEHIGPFAQETAGRTVVGGVLAAATGVLASSLVIAIVGFVGRLTGGTAAPSPEHTSGELELLFGWPLFFAVAMVIVAIFTWARLDRLPLVGRLIVTAALPLAATLLLLDPLTDISRVGLPATDAVALSAVTALRWAAFALVFEWLPLREARVPVK